MLVVCGGGGPGDGCCGHGGGGGGGGGAEDKPSVAVRCAGCGGKISDRYYLLAVDRQWHVACLTCCQCKVQLDSELTCFARDGHIYCKEDYYRLFSVKRCTRCHLSISPSELVMRAREHVYHLHCFTCATCNKPLTKGEYFGLKDDIIYCRTHYEMLLQYERPQNPYLAQSLKEENAKMNDAQCAIRCDFNNTSSLQSCALELAPFHQHHHNHRSSASPASKLGGQKGRPRKQKNFLSATMVVPHRGPVVGNADDGCVVNGAQPPTIPQQSSSNNATAGSDSSTSSEHMTRPKRMRTSFKHHQLRTMKSYFSINHNPDAKDLKQLSQKTGLSKRVLQVWFQNARAKWRRNLLRQQSQGPEIAQDSKPLAELTSQPHFCDPLRIGAALVDVQPTPITQEEQNIQTFTNLL